MAAHSGTRTVHNTLSTTVVDTVNLTGSWRVVEISNRAAAAGATMWVTLGKDTDTLADPVASANETFQVGANTSLIIEIANGASVPVQVKILGSANPYSVIGMPEFNSPRCTLG